MQTTRGHGYRKRFSSWYDQHLLTRHGEEILGALDDLAIKQLKKHQLIWQSWVAFKPNFSNLNSISPNHSYRLLRINNARELQRFFISISWRAAASDLPDMRYAELPSNILEEMRRISIGEIDPEPTVYPVSLIQLTTKGTIHNMVPAVEKKDLGPFGLNKEIDFVRIYFDGLVAHVNLTRDRISKDEKAKVSPFIGETEETFVTGVTYEASWEYENLLYLTAEVHGPIETFFR